jgi:hypothetical protein
MITRFPFFEPNRNLTRGRARFTCGFGLRVMGNGTAKSYSWLATYLKAGSGDHLQSSGAHGFWLLGNGLGVETV